MAVLERIDQQSWEQWRIRALKALQGVEITHDSGTDLQDSKAFFCISVNSDWRTDSEFRMIKDTENILAYLGFRPKKGKKITLLKGRHLPQNGVVGWTGWPTGRSEYPERNVEANLELDHVLLHFLKKILGKDRIMNFLKDFLGERYVRALGKEITTVHFHEMRILINQIRYRERQRQSKIVTN